MTIQQRFRSIHRRLAPWLFAPLLLIAITGLTYRIGRSWFAMSKETGNEVLFFHTGAWFGTNGSMIYLSLIGSALILLVASGLWMGLGSKGSKKPLRKSHRMVAIAFFLPLLLSAITGIAYHVGSHGFQIDETTQKLLMSLHQGTWLGPKLRPFYILLLGTGLITLCLTGLRICLPATLFGKKNG